MGCIITQQCTLIIGTNVKKPIQGSWEEELEFRKIFTSEQIMVCPFCRAKESTTSKAHLKRLWEQIDDFQDSYVLIFLGKYYLTGYHHLSKNLTRAEEFYQKAYALGDLVAANSLAELYTIHCLNRAHMWHYL